MNKVPPFLLLDAFRGLAALCVVMFHSSMSFLLEHPVYTQWPWYEVCNVGCYGVQAFFVISGYCIAGAGYRILISGEDLRSFVAGRFWRIYPPYLATVALAAVVLAAVLMAREHGYEPPPTYYMAPQPGSGFFWAATLLLQQVELRQFCLVMVFWTLCYEILFYILIGLFLSAARIFSREGRTQVVFFFGAVGLTTQASLVWLLISPATCPFPFDRWYQFGLGAILFQVMAARFAEGTDAGLARRVAWGQMGIALGLAAIFAFLYRLEHKPEYYFPEVVTCLMVTILLWVLFPWERRLAGWRLMFPFMWLGTISYSLYLTHAIALPFISTGFRQLGFDGDWYLVTALVFIAISVLGSWIFYQAVERHFISPRQKKRIAEELKEPATG